MKAYLIIPNEKCIEEIDFDPTDFKEISKILHCDWFTRVGFGLTTSNGGQDGLYVDDEGLINGRAKTEGQFWFTGYHRNGDTYVHQIAGRGIAMGTDGAGENADVEISMTDFKAMVSFDRPENWVDVVPGFTITTIN